MSLRERTGQVLETAKRRALENKYVAKAVDKGSLLYDKGRFAYKMGFDSSYRAAWVNDQVQQDLSSGIITEEQSVRILEQARDPKVNRHLAETFAVPIAAYGITAPVVGGVAVYAWMTGEAWAVGYTASHLFTQQIPKVSVSSFIRSTALAGSIAYDHIKERNLGTRKQNSTEATAVAVSAVSWMGIGNAGPFLRMVAGTSPDLGMYLAKKTLKGKAQGLVEKAALGASGS